MKNTQRKIYGDGFVYERDGVYWVAYSFNGRRLREPAKNSEGKSVRVPDEVMALKFLHYRLGQVQADQSGLQAFVGPSERRISVGDLLDGVVAERRRNQRRDTASFRSELKLVREEFGHMRALAVTDRVIDDYVEAEKRKGARNATVNRKLEKLKQGFLLGVRRKRITRMPEFAMLSEKDNVRQGYFEHDDFLRLRGQFEDEDLEDFCSFAYLTGWRKGSIEALEWEPDFDMNNVLMRLRPESTKEKQANWIPLEGDLEDIIVRRWHRRIVKRADNTVLISRYVFHRGDGKKFGDFEKAWLAACKKAGLIKVVEDADGSKIEKPSKLFHDLRRTSYRNMRRAGVDGETARTIVGHKTASMQRRYQIVDGDEKAVALNQVQAYLKGVEAKREDREKRLLRFANSR